MQMHKVLFRNEDVTVYARHGQTILEVARQAGVDPYPVLGGKASCHGKGLCGTCLVHAEPEASLAPKDKREAWRTSGKGLAALMLPQIPGDVPGLRLACRAQVTGELRVTTSPDTRLSWKRHPYYSGRPVHSWSHSATGEVPAEGEPVGGPAGGPVGRQGGEA